MFSKQINSLLKEMKSDIFVLHSTHNYNLHMYVRRNEITNTYVQNLRISKEAVLASASPQ